MFRKIYFTLSNKISFIFKRSFINMALNIDKKLNVKNFIQFVLNEKELVHMIKNKKLKRVKTEYNVLQYDKYASTFNSKGVEPSIKLSDNFLSCLDDYFEFNVSPSDSFSLVHDLYVQISHGKCYDDEKTLKPGYPYIVDLNAKSIEDTTEVDFTIFKKDKFKIHTSGILTYLVRKAELKRGVIFNISQAVTSFGNTDLSCFFLTKKQLRILIDEYNTSTINGISIKANFAFDEFVTLKIKNFELLSKREIKNLKSCGHLSINNAPFWLENLVSMLNSNKIYYGTDNNPYCKVTLCKKDGQVTIDPPNKLFQFVCVQETFDGSFTQLIDRSILDLLTSRISAERSFGLTWSIIDELAPIYGSEYVTSILDDHMFCPFFVIVIEEQLEIKHLI